MADLFRVQCAGPDIVVLLKPHNATPDNSYTVNLYEGNLLVGNKQVSWSEDDLAAQRDAQVIFCLTKLSPQVEQGTADVHSVYHVTMIPATPPISIATTTPTLMPLTTPIYQGGTTLDVDLHSVKTGVDAYVLQANEWPTADGSLPPQGQYALIDFNASFVDNGGKTMSFYPHFISKLPRHWDEGVWRIDSAALVSVDIAPDKY